MGQSQREHRADVSSKSSAAGRSDRQLTFQPCRPTEWPMALAAPAARSYLTQNETYPTLPHIWKPRRVAGVWTQSRPGKSSGPRGSSRSPSAPRLHYARRIVGPFSAAAPTPVVGALHGPPDEPAEVHRPISPRFRRNQKSVNKGNTGSWDPACRGMLWADSPWTG